jgi:hypothetical protein
MVFVFELELGSKLEKLLLDTSSKCSSGNEHNPHDCVSELWTATASE